MRATPSSARGAWVVALGLLWASACSDDGVEPVTVSPTTSTSDGTSTASVGGGSGTGTTTGASTTTAATSIGTTTSNSVGTTGAGGGTSGSTTSAVTTVGSTDAGSEGTTSTSDGMAAGGTAGASAATTGATTGGATTPSSGCGLDVSQQPGQWVEQPALMVDNTPRDWSVWLPNNYDPERAYPLVVLLHGCGGITNNVPIQNESGDDAIVIRGAAAQQDNCWNTQESGPNDEFFDAMLDTAMAQMCIDSERVFAAGYSSGSWLIGLLNCVRADRLRAVGTVAGGNPIGFGTPNCNGNVAAIFIHDQNDPENDISGSESVRDRLLEQNACSDTTMPTSPDPCVAYEGCQAEYPVHWCPTSGEGHNRQDQFAAPAMWDFFSQFL